jgi:N-acetylmuramidase
MATKTETPKAPPAAKQSPAKKAAAKTPLVKKTAAKKATPKAAAAKPAATKKVAAKKVATDKVATKKAKADKLPVEPRTVSPASPRKAPAKKTAARGRAISRGLANAVAVTAGLPDGFFDGYTGERLTEDDYAAAAQALGCQVAAIKAVAEVESKESPFDAKNRPTILYERHIFARATVPPGKFNASHPDLSAKAGYGPGGYGTKDAQYGKLARAYALDPEAALKAPSWGKFQILGINHKDCGYASVTEFVGAMTVSEREHLRAFARFVAASSTRLKALRNLDWAEFARLYNGPEYAKFKYDQKMAAAYRKFAA